MIQIKDLVVQQELDREAMVRICGGAIIWEGVVRRELTGYELVNGAWNKVEKDVTLRIQEIFSAPIYTPVNTAMSFWV